MCVTLLILIKSLNANPAYSSVTINVDEPANHLIFSFRRLQYYVGGSLAIPFIKHNNTIRNPYICLLLISPPNNPALAEMTDFSLM